ncbi:MAG: TIGR02281 family clan AA aspartic protease [Shinella sp.]|nr:TIGR02281 family clan AA aspartic protease [Shinella sp.]
MNRLTILLGILGFGLVMLIYNHDSGRTFGLGNDEFGRLVMLTSLAALFGAGILAGRRHFGESMRQAGIWILIILVLMVGYLYRYDLQSVTDRLTAGLIPGRAVVTTGADGAQILVIHKMEGGHFETSASIDGMPVRMLVDTGASSVVLSYADAERLGLDPQNLTYNISVATANGQAFAAPVRLDEIAIGPIVRRNVRAMVADRGRLDQSLLGMTFLETLGSIEITRDELRLRD